MPFKNKNIITVFFLFSALWFWSYGDTNNFTVDIQSDYTSTILTDDNEPNFTDYELDKYKNSSVIHFVPRALDIYFQSLISRKPCNDTFYPKQIRAPPQ